MADYKRILVAVDLTEHSDRVVYRRANDRAGTHWGQRVSVDASVTDSRNISLCEVGSNPCVVYNTTGDGGATSSGSMFCVLHN